MTKTIEEHFFIGGIKKPNCPNCKQNESVQSRFAWNINHPENPITSPLIDWRCSNCQCEFF